MYKINTFEKGRLIPKDISFTSLKESDEYLKKYFKKNYYSRKKFLITNDSGIIAVADRYSYR